MTERISIRISDILASKIRRSGLSKTEYTRRALESYSENKENVMRYNKIATVSECINVLEKFRDNLQCDLLNQQYADFEESVRQKSEICQTNLSDKTDESVRLSDKNEEFVRHFVRQNHKQVSDKNAESVRQMSEDPMYETYKPYIELLSKMLNIHNNIPEETKRKIKNETNTTMHQLNDFLFRYRKEIMTCNYTIASETVKIDYEDAKKM